MPRGGRRSTTFTSDTARRAGLRSGLARVRKPAAAAGLEPEPSNVGASEVAESHPPWTCATAPPWRSCVVTQTGHDKPRLASGDLWSNASPILTTRSEPRMMSRSKRRSGSRWRRRLIGRSN